MADKIAERGPGALQLVVFGEVDYQHVSQLAVGRCKRAEPLASGYVRLERIRHTHRRDGLRFVEAVAEFVDEVAVAFFVERRFESVADETLGGGLVHGLIPGRVQNEPNDPAQRAGM